MKKIKNIIVILAAVSLFSSCSKWLDVTPPSQIPEDAQFETVEGFQQALIGCYIGMTDQYLYGRTLSWSVFELMAGQFAPLFPISSNDSGIASYNYKSSNAIKYIDGIWINAYEVIANVNNALKFIEIRKSMFDDVNYRLIKGELLAIRACMHFDLMKIYGYGNLSARLDVQQKSTIPYVTVLGKNLTSQLNYSQTLALMEKDLEDAITLLEIDPVTKSKPDSYYAEANSDGFYNNRQHRFNYYATSLLLARVYLWEGSKASIDKALTLSKRVVDNAESKGLVRWTTSESITDDVNMKSEHLMSLNTQNLILSTSEYFKISIIATDYKAQYVSGDRAEQIFEVSTVGGTDYRFTKQFIMNTMVVNGKNSYTPLKYYGTSSSTSTTSDYIPFLRIPEAYYIAAECMLKQTTPDIAGATQILNQVRLHRGITTELQNLDAASLMNEIIKEYSKEFYCEGQMFFLYKRLGSSTIPGYNQTANDAIYLLPYPDAEIQMGRTQ